MAKTVVMAQAIWTVAVITGTMFAQNIPRRNVASLMHGDGLQIVRIISIGEKTVTVAVNSIGT